jgi:Glycosyl transferase family 2
MPHLSIVIPTLGRPDTLRHALATLVVQQGADCEFIVQNNGGDPAVAALVDGLDDPRFHHVASADIVPMTENWERALAAASGDYVLFIGDDDGLMPDACALAAHVLALRAPALLSWLPFAYYWPGYYHEGWRNRLIAAIDFRFTAERVAAGPLLQQVYRFQAHYSRLPMIYNSFVRRDVIEAMRQRCGRYFLGYSPDVTSGIANAALTPDFLRLTRPLSISGLSRHSTGHRLFFAEADALSSATGQRDFGALAKDPRLPDLNALSLFLANDMLLLKRRLFPDQAAIEVDFRGLAQAVAAEINDRPELYDRTWQSLLDLAHRHGFDPFTLAVPARAASRPGLRTGLRLDGPARVEFVLDGDALGLCHIADAVRVMAQFLPRIDALDLAETAAPPQTSPAPTQQPQTPQLQTAPLPGLGFGRGGAGLAVLGEGWSEPEEWGTWSVARFCSLRLAIRPLPVAPVTMALACRGFVTAAHPSLAVRTQAGTAAPVEREFTLAAPAAEWRLLLDPAGFAPDGSVRISFTISEPHSPAELGASDDTRPLGLGIERLWIVG